MKLQGHVSDPVASSTGAPQGSVLSLCSTQTSTTRNSVASVHDRCTRDGQEAEEAELVYCLMTSLWNIYFI